MKADKTTRARAKALRRPLTKAELILWSRLKGRRLRNWQFRVQHPVSPYILDFACAPLKLAIEVDGETHSSEDERAHDERRQEFLEARGWTVLRFWNSEVYTNLDGALETILRRLPERAPRPLRQRRKSAAATSPSPLD